MDSAAKRSYVRLRLERAHEDLANARSDLASGHLRGAVNRAYYAIFHTASAALLWIGVQRAKHSGVQSAFNEHFVKPGGVDSELGRTYSKARKLREEQDYDLDATALDEATVHTVIEAAAEFVDVMEQLLARSGAFDLDDSEP